LASQLIACELPPRTAIKQSIHPPVWSAPVLFAPILLAPILFAPILFCTGARSRLCA
jgi:hypothetical protein